MKKWLCMLLCAALLFSACSVAAAAGPLPGTEALRYEGPGFDTPEDAVLYYLSGLKNLDMEQMLGAFAWETQAEHFSFRDQVLRLKGFSPVNIPGMPFTGSLLTSAGVEQLRGGAENSIYAALEWYFLGDSHYMYTPTASRRFADGAEADEFLALYSAEKIDKLAGMSEVSFYNPSDVTEGKFSLPKMQENFEKQTRPYGADEVVNVVAVADLGDEKLAVAPTVARYGNRWYLVSVGSMVSAILGIDVNRQAFTVLPEELAGALPYVTPVKTAVLPEGRHPAFRYEGDGFATPEEAVVFYMEGLKAGNVQKMLGAFAWETQAEHYSVKENILRYTVIMMSQPVRMPSAAPGLVSANCAALRRLQGWVISQSIRYYVLQDADPESAAGQLNQNYSVSLKSEEEADAFIGAFDNPRPGKLAGMTGLRTVPTELLMGEKYRSETTQKLLESYKRIYGADEITDLVGVADLGDEILVCNPLLARYGDRWYIVSVSGIFMVSSSVGANLHAFFTVPGSYEDAVKNLVQ